MRSNHLTPRDFRSQLGTTGVSSLDRKSFTAKLAHDKWKSIYVLMCVYVHMCVHACVYVHLCVCVFISGCYYTMILFFMGPGDQIQVFLYAKQALNLLSHFLGTREKLFLFFLRTRYCVLLIMSPKQCPHLVTCSTSHSSLCVAHISEAVLHSSEDLGRPVLMASEYVLVEFSTFSNDMAHTTNSLIPNMALSGSRLFPVAAPKGTSPAQPKDMRHCTA